MRKTIISLALSLCAASGYANDHTVRVVPNKGDREQPEFVLGSSKQHWSSSKFVWYYNPTNQPANLTTDAVVHAMLVAAARWSAMCRISFVYMGTTTATPYRGDDPSGIDNKNIVGWGALSTGPGIEAGVAESWASKDSIADADITLNVNLKVAWTANWVDAVMTHEFGHAIGVKHSDVQESIMQANPYHDFDYQRTLRGDDAAACAALYGESSTVQSARTFNWAEEAYPEFLSPGPAESGTYDGYYYRYYPGTKSYLGSRDGIVYFLNADGMMFQLKPLDYFAPWVKSWGY